MKDPTSTLLTVDRAADWLTSGGETGRLVRSMDWSKTPHGPIESWPRSLKATLGVVLGSRFPMLLWGSPDWGTDVEITAGVAATRRSDFRRARV